MDKKIIFDICGTLYDSNTTFDFLDFFLKNNKKYNNILRLRKKMIFKIINFVLNKYLNYDLVKKISVKCLKGYSKNELKEAMNIFYEEKLVNKKNKEAFKIFNSSKLENIILLSASLDFIVEVIAEKNGVKNYYSSVLSYEKNICSGIIRKDILKIKKNIFLNLIKKQNEEYCFITDNIQDVKLLESVDNPIIFLNRKNFNYFKKNYLKYKRIGDIECEL